MGKAEGHGENWHGHVTALTVSPDFRRLGVANTLMAYLEEVSEKWVQSSNVLLSFNTCCGNKIILSLINVCYYMLWFYFPWCCFQVPKSCYCFDRKRAYFVDLFVRVSNQVAIKMYTALGYIVYRTVLEYYSGDPDEDAYGEN